MGAMPDLTLQQIHEKCNNPEVAEYIANMAVLPENISLCEFLAIILQAASVAQIAACNAETEAKTGLKKLAAYPLPSAGAVLTDTTKNVQFYKCSYKLNAEIWVSKKGKIYPDHA